LRAPQQRIRAPVVTKGRHARPIAETSAWGLPLRCLFILWNVPAGLTLTQRKLAGSQIRPVRMANVAGQALLRSLLSAILIRLHTLAAVVWVGGMFFAYNVLRPSTGPLEPAERLALWQRVLSRFFPWVLHYYFYRTLRSIALSEGSREHETYSDDRCSWTDNVIIFRWPGLLTERAEAKCVWRMVTAWGSSSALTYKVKRRRAFRRAHRHRRRYVEKTYGSPFSHFGYARYSSQTFNGIRTARVRGVPCDANQ
jgi:hypothetical protein